MRTLSLGQGTEYPFAMRASLSVGLSLMVATAVLGCGDDGAADGGGGAGAGLPAAIAEHEFGAFEPWALPIEDYKAVGEQELPGDYDPGIHELMPFGDRMWLGYGDGTYNMGTYTPIELRYFASETDPAASAATVSAAGEGAPQTIPTQSGEEQIDRYRVCDGELYQAGVDSTDADELDTQATTDPKAIDGNAYRLAGDTWEKHRSIRGGEHVHDFAAWGGAIYGVGSGADLRTEFEAGEIFRYLWRSDDKTATFTTVQRVPHPAPGMGDTRWVHLLSTTSKLFLFGYESDFQTGNASVENGSYSGGASVAPLDAADPLAAVFAFGTLSLPDGSGVVYGVDVAANPLKYGAWHVSPDGVATKLDGLAGRHIADLGAYPDSSEILFLTYPGDAYPGTEPVTFDATVLVAPMDAPNETTQIAAHSSPVGLRALAYWRHGLFLGTADGQVLKAAHDPGAE